MSWGHRPLLGLVLFLLAACGTTPPPAPLEPRPPRASLQRFSLEARAVISQPQRADSLRMSWQHSPQEDYLGFASPLGHVMAELQRDAQGARWLGADGERYDAARPDELFAHLTDVPVPLDALSEWMLGRVTEQASQVRRDELGRLQTANDRGWTIRILGYESPAVDALPSVIELAFDSLRIRLKIENWSL